MSTAQVVFDIIAIPASAIALVALWAWALRQPNPMPTVADADDALAVTTDISIPA
ncbi:MAG TPA: hypothetical protein VHD87_15210 [Acidimicrobiales bacterium]|nr:hypothetical protein [Acidimicrobiales bacterium]